MRVLFTTRGSAGHLLPLVPFAQACRRAGHGVLVAAQEQNRGDVERTGLDFSPVPDPPAEEWVPLMAQFPRLGIVQANEQMVGEFFAGIDTRAALPALRAVVERWKPDLVVRESWEYASTIVAEERAIPLVRVGLSLAAIEDRSTRLAAFRVDEQRVAAGLPADPAGERLRDTPYLTMVPEPLDAGGDDAGAVPARTHRFASEGVAAEPPPLAQWWLGNDDPLVLVSFGSVAAGSHLPYFPAIYRAAIEALAPLRARILVTTGDAGDPERLGSLPANVHVERWVAQDAVAPHAAAMVCHGGYGSTLAALRHGVPLAVLPLFSMDQWVNAAAVARAGAGIALHEGIEGRPALGLPADGVLAAIAPAVQRLIDDASFAIGASAIAAAARALPPVDDAVEVLRAYAT